MYTDDQYLSLIDNIRVPGTIPNVGDYISWFYLRMKIRHFWLALM